jgi:hypothetical protein
MLRSSRTGPTKIGSLTRASAVIVGALVALFGVIAGPLLGVFATSASAATASGYTAITPYRALGASAAGTPVVAGTPATVQITSSTAGEVPAGATAAVLNVTASNPTSAGYLEVYPTGAAPSSPTSNVNFVAGETVPNLVTVPLSSTGGISVLNSAGTTAVDVDVEGYYSAAGAGLYNPVAPVRVAGTPAAGTPIGNNATIPVTVAGGITGIPSNATAVVVNLTAAGGTAASYLSAYAVGATPAITSSVNFTAGETVANRDIVNVGTGGAIDVYNLAGSVNVDVDVDGYYGPTGATFTALTTPVRVADTRTATLVGSQTSIGSGTTEVFNLTTTASGIPSTATSVAANFTVVPGAAPGYIQVFPTGEATPTGTAITSDVNWPASSGPVANFTQANTAGSTAGSVQVYNLNSGSPIDLVVDDFGYFTGGTVATTATPVADAVTAPTTPATGAVPANGSTTEAINSTVYHGTAIPGNLVANDSVLYTVAAGTATTCGTVTPTAATTNASGVASVTYKAPAYATTAIGNCVVTATDSLYGETSAITIAQSAPANSIAVTGNANVPAAVTSTDTLSATVTPGTTGESVNSDVITFTKSATPAGVCGTITTTETTPATGAATVTDLYTATAVSGICYIDVTDTSGANTEVAIDQTNPSLATASVAQTTTTPDNVTTGAAVTDNVTVTNSGGPLVGDQVAFSLAGDCGTNISPSFTVTAAGGVASYAYTAPATPGACVITAQEADSGSSAALTINQSAPAATTTIAGGASIAPGTGETITVSTTNAPTTDASSAITFTVTGVSGFSGCGTIPATTGAAISPYGGTSTYTAGGSSGFCTITATEGGVTSTPLTVDQT